MSIQDVLSSREATTVPSDTLDIAIRRLKLITKLTFGTLQDETASLTWDEQVSLMGLIDEIIKHLEAGAE